MNDFLQWISEKVMRYPLHIEINYSMTTYWRIYIYKKNCADKYIRSKRNGNDAVLCDVQHGDINYCFAKAHTEVKEWLMVNEEGY